MLKKSTTPVSLCKQALSDAYNASAEGIFGQKSKWNKRMS